MTSRGAVRTVLPTAGLARSRWAWACAAAPMRSNAVRVSRNLRMSASGRAAEQRPSDRVREYIVEIEVQLDHAADAGAACGIDRDDRLEPDLEGVGGEDHAGIDRAGG